MAQSPRYALWLKPDAVADQQLQAVINQLAARYHAPVYFPHMTLLPRLFGEETDLSEKASQLASSLKPIAVRLTGFAGAPYYFRCFYAPLASSSELRQAVNDATELFQSGAGSDFLPHISLLYGQLHRDEKKQIPAVIGDAVPVSFRLDRLQLVRMALSVSAWEVINEFPLTGN